MIRHLRGTIIHTSDKDIVLDVNGVGYHVFPTRNILLTAQLHSEISLWTHMAIRENAMDIFGFSDMQSLTFFEMLLGVSGIGPRSALGIIDIAPIATVQKAIAHDDISYLTKVSGIGKRTAEKIVVELRNKLSELKTDDTAGMQSDHEVLEALQALGYSLNEARNALQELPDDIVGTNERIKKALQYINQ